MNTGEIINQVTRLSSIKDVQNYAATVFDAVAIDELDDAVLDAMDARIAELYKPSEKQIARQNLIEAFALFRKYDKPGNLAAAARQAAKCQKLQAVYDSL